MSRWTLAALVAAALGAALIEPVRMPLGVLAGGALMLLNVYGIRRGLAGLMARDPSPGLLFMAGALRLLIMGAALAALIMARVVSIAGLVAGVMIVTVAVSVEGYRASREGGGGA